ncbi:MAG: hypothetical protein ABFC24_05415 [Methanoregulaceae archaeon]
MREKIRVPRKAYDELMALNREIHFTSNHLEIIKKADDRNYNAAAEWLRNNEEDFKIGFAWGFEPVDTVSTAPRSAGKTGSDDLEPRVSKGPASPAKKPTAPPKKSGGFFSRLFGK